MKSKFSFSITLTVVVLVASMIISSATKNSKTHNLPENVVVSTSDEIKPDTQEMRGLWVSYITLDMQSTDKSFLSFKKKFKDITDKAKELQCNTLIVQIRPFSDALYNSEIFPCSHILSGTQGKSAGYDALEYMCEQAHKANLSIHAWINPYRVKSKDTPATLAKNNIFITNPQLCIETGSGVYLNPAKKQCRELILKGIREIAENYDIDGIQFDDYFYPPDIKDEDLTDYNTYKKSMPTGSAVLSTEEWRKNNVNILIAEVCKEIKNIDENITFGISPQGNLKNNAGIYADIESWCRYAGYIDYICPQVYFSVDNPTLKFEDCLQEWSDLTYHCGIKVYIGLAVYKAGTSADNGTWLEDNSILATELNLVRKYNFSGYMLYDYNATLSDTAEEEINNLVSIIQ